MFALFLMLAVLLTIYFVVPGFLETVFIGADYTPVIIILYYLPGLFVLMGIFEVMMPEAMVVHYLGKKSGFKGATSSFILGALLPGPAFLAFPLAAMLLRKGVSTYNVVLFISAWATFNLTEEVFEIQFLGWKFFFLRFVITIPFLLLMAFLMQGDEWGEKHAKKRAEVHSKRT